MTETLVIARNMTVARRLANELNIENPVCLPYDFPLSALRGCSFNAVVVDDLARAVRSMPSASLDAIMVCQTL